jgi:chromate transporter
VLSEIAILFSTLAVVSFGGAYAVLAHLEQQAVVANGWIDAGQMMDAFGLAETTPGPLILVNQFIGFLAGWQAPGGGPLVATAAAFLASWQTFAASFLWIFAGAPYAERLRSSRRAAGALKAIGAAVIGVIAHLAWSFGARTLFARTFDLDTPFGRPIALPILWSIDLVAASIALAAGFALIRLKANVVGVALACLAAGAAATALRAAF